MQTADTSRIQQALVWVSDFKPFLSENLRESDTDVGFTVDGKSDIGKTVNGIAVNGKANANKYYLSNYGRIKYYPDIISIYQSENRRFVAVPCKNDEIDRWMGWICVQFRVENQGLFRL